MVEEVGHVKEVLEETRLALKQNDSIKLKELSNQTIHAASIYQDTDSISIAIITYSLSKILERKDGMRIKNWNKLMKKIDAFLSLAIKALKENNMGAFGNHLGMIRRSIESISPNLKSQIEEVMRKASINKASRIYEHGISLGQTASLLGLTQWELSQYTGQTKISDDNYNRTIDTKKRAKMALEFFS